MKYIFIAIILSFKTYAVDYKYDNAKRITEAAYKDGTVVSYTYDKNGNLLSVSPTKSSTDDDRGSDDTNSDNTDNTSSKPAKSGSGGGVGWFLLMLTASVMVLRARFRAKPL